MPPQHDLAVLQAINNIDTKGNDYSFTVRYYGVSQDVVDGRITPELSVA